MARLETILGIRKVLADNAAVAALVGVRIYPLFDIPQSVKKPYITYSLSSGEHAHYISGSAAGHAYQDIDIHCMAETDIAMRELGTKVRKALDGYSGTVTVGSDSVIINSCLLQNELDDVAAPSDGGKTPIYIRQLEFQVGNNTEIV